MKKTALVFDELFLNHISPPMHPERPERLGAIAKLLDEENYFSKVTLLPLKRVETEELELIHSHNYINNTKYSLSKKDSGYLDMGETFYSPGSFDAAYYAAGGGSDLALRVFKGEFENGAVLVRPPGHHAEKNQAMGFCIFNNVAIAAANLLENGAKRVAILDFDVHHGNGTQHSFEYSDSIMYCSIHQSPLFPGTGELNEIGKEKGKGFTINSPMAPYCNDIDWLYSLRNLILPSIKVFNPDIILVSAGFDAHKDDDISSQSLTDQGFLSIETEIQALADTICDGKVATFLEGGYNLSALARGVANYLNVFLNHPKPDLTLYNSPPSRTTEATVASVQKLLS